MTNPWTIHDLTAITQQALQAADYQGQTSGRVRSTPDSRTIRYYTTLGLLDPPLEMHGRTAIYGQRHVLQIAAIKRLQADGLSLAAVQRQLPGATSQQLTAWAGLPADFWENLTESPSPTSAEPAEADAPAPDNTAESARQPDFWQQPPATASTQAEENTDTKLQPAAQLTPAAVIRLAPEMALTLEGAAAQKLTPEKLTAITPLLQQLVEKISQD